MARSADTTPATVQRRELTTEHLTCFECGGWFGLTVVQTGDGPTVLCSRCRP